MFNFTREEQTIIIFLLIAILVGGGIILYRQFQRQNVVPEVVPSELTQTPKSVEKIVVHITGAVKKPGVYKLKKGSRVMEGVKMAGGETEEANLNAINLARVLSDGEMVRVPEKIESGMKVPLSSVLTEVGQGKVSLNLADKTQLESLPGIGPALAKRIIDYRNKNGFFKTKEELKKVSGIGEKKFNTLKDLISVN